MEIGLLRRTKRLDAFERRQVEESDLDLAARRRIYEAMYRYATSLGVFPLKDPLDGIDVDIHLAGALNVRTGSREDRPGA